jgi:phosphoserine phosphatase
MGLLLADVDELLARLPAREIWPADVDAVAVFDADHTLWDGDIGDHAFLCAVDAGFVLPATWQGPVRAWAQDWGLSLPREPSVGARQIVEAAESGALSAAATARGLLPSAWKGSLYAMQAWAYAGRSRDEVLDFGERLFAEGFAARIWADMRAVVHGLQERGIAVRIASASHGALVVPGGRRLGLSADAVQGMEARQDDAGILEPHLGVDTYGPGKADVVSRALRGRRPLLGLGDSVLATDRELLALAHVGVAVATKGEHRQAALADDRLWMFDPRR